MYHYWFKGEFLISLLNAIFSFKPEDFEFKDSGENKIKKGKLNISDKPHSIYNLEKECISLATKLLLCLTAFKPMREPSNEEKNYLNVSNPNFSLDDDNEGIHQTGFSSLQSLSTTSSSVDFSLPSLFFEYNNFYSYHLYNLQNHHYLFIFSGFYSYSFVSVDPRTNSPLFSTYLAPPQDVRKCYYFYYFFFKFFCFLV
jgi:hypothetical protein